MKKATAKVKAAIQNANRNVVKNYNAANRALNRAPAWAKWTVGIVAVGIIVYVLWKLLWPRREGFKSGSAPDAPNGWSRYTYADVRQESGFSTDIDRVDLGDLYIDSGKIGEYVNTANSKGCNAFSIFNNFDGRTLLIYKKIKEGALCESRPEPNSVVMYIKNDTDGNPIIPLDKCGTLQWTHLLTTDDPLVWRDHVKKHVLNSRGAQAVIQPGTEPIVNQKIDWSVVQGQKNDVTLGGCYGSAPDVSDAYAMVWERTSVNTSVDGGALGKCGACVRTKICEKGTGGSWTVSHALKTGSSSSSSSAETDASIDTAKSAVGAGTGGCWKEDGGETFLDNVPFVLQNVNNAVMYYNSTTGEISYTNDIASLKIENYFVAGSVKQSNSTGNGIWKKLIKSYDGMKCISRVGGEIGKPYYWFRMEAIPESFGSEDNNYVRYMFEPISQGSGKWQFKHYLPDGKRVALSYPGNMGNTDAWAYECKTDNDMVNTWTVKLKEIDFGKEFTIKSVSKMDKTPSLLYATETGGVAFVDELQNVPSGGNGKWKYDAAANKIYITGVGLLKVNYIQPNNQWLEMDTNFVSENTFAIEKDQSRGLFKIKKTGSGVMQDHFATAENTNSTVWLSKDTDDKVFWKLENV